MIVGATTALVWGLSVLVAAAIAAAVYRTAERSDSDHPLAWGTGAFLVLVGAFALVW